MTDYPRQGVSLKVIANDPWSGNRAGSERWRVAGFSAGHLTTFAKPAKLFRQRATVLFSP
jgi:hypothetical protein